MCTNRIPKERIVMLGQRTLLHGARTRWALWGAAVLFVVGAVGLAHQYRGSSSSSTLTPARVTREFATRGLALEADPSSGLAPGSHAHLVGPVLWNRPRAAVQGVVTVIVTRSASEAKGLLTRFQASNLASEPSVCGSADYRMWQARNVVASFTSCDYVDGVAQEATSPAETAVATAMAALIE
jgi:hypothetical protein